MSTSKKDSRRKDAYITEPIRTMEAVRKIRKMLLDRGELRNALLFCLAVNCGARIGDLLDLRVKHVRHLPIDGSFRFHEEKTGKGTLIVINQVCHKILTRYLAEGDLEDEDFLFPSQKGRSKLDPRSVNFLVKKWTSESGLQGNYGCHSLRKTFGFLQRTVFKADFALLCEKFNHSSPSITKRYLGIQESEIRDMLLHQI